MRSMETLEFRNLGRAELDVLLGWAAKEGWNPGLRDAEIFWNTDPEAFWGFEIEGRLAGGGAIVSYSGQLGFMGLFIVAPKYRGQGLGRQLWYFRRDQLLKRLKPGASIAMDGVFAMQHFYGEGGFVFTHRNLRMEGVGKRTDPDPRVVPLREVDFQKVLEFDARHFGILRPAFLKPWITPEGGYGAGLLDDDGLQGMGVVRPCQNGFKIGPLFAESAEVADTLFTVLSAQAAGKPLFLDTPEINKEALALAERHGMEESFGCARMVFGPPMQLPWERIYGVTTFELG